MDFENKREPRSLALSILAPILFAATGYFSCSTSAYGSVTGIMLAKLWHFDHDPHRICIDLSGLD